MSTNNETIVLSGPLEVSYGRYAMLKGALKLESVGMKTRGGPLRPKLAKEFKLSPRAPHADYIAYCVGRMAELLAEKQAQAKPTN